MIKVNYRALGMLSTNCYVVENPDSQKVLIVDPGDSLYLCLGEGPRRADQ